MHPREVLASAASTVGDTMHIVLSGVTVLFMLLAIGSGAAAFGKRFRLLSDAPATPVDMEPVLAFNRGHETVPMP